MPNARRIRFAMDRWDLGISMEAAYGKVQNLRPLAEACVWAATSEYNTVEVSATLRRSSVPQHRAYPARISSGIRRSSSVASGTAGREDRKCDSLSMHMLRCQKASWSVCSCSCTCHQSRVENAFGELLFVDLQVRQVALGMTRQYAQSQFLLQREAPMSIGIQTHSYVH